MQIPNDLWQKINLNLSTILYHVKTKFFTKFHDNGNFCLKKKKKENSSQEKFFFSSKNSIFDKNFFKLQRILFLKKKSILEYLFCLIKIFVFL